MTIEELDGFRTASTNARTRYLELRDNRPRYACLTCGAAVYAGYDELAIELARAEYEEATRLAEAAVLRWIKEQT